MTRRSQTTEMVELFERRTELHIEVSMMQERGEHGAAFDAAKARLDRIDAEISRARRRS